MKKIISIVLIASIYSSLQVVAQQRASAVDEYNKWKEKNLAKYSSGILPPHYCLVAASQRLDEKSARIEFYAVGKKSGIQFEIQPLKIERLANGEYKQNGSGRVTKSMLKNRSGEHISIPTNLTVIVPVNSDANALEVRWIVEGEPSEIKVTTTLPLEDRVNSYVTVIGKV